MFAHNHSIEQIDRLKKQFMQMDLPGVTDLLDAKHLCEMIDEATEKEAR